MDILLADSSTWHVSVQDKLYGFPFNQITRKHIVSMIAVDKIIVNVSTS